jgi:hypothetical protein
MPETVLATEDEITEESEMPDRGSEANASPTQIGTESLFLKLYLTKAPQRGVPTSVEVLVTSIDEIPLSDAEITLFLSSDLVYWFKAAKSTTNREGIAKFNIDAGRLATLKARTAFLGDEKYANSESNTLVLVI